MAIATGIGPSDLLAAPPRVLAAIVELLEEQEREQRRARMRDRLRRAMGK